MNAVMYNKKRPVLEVEISNRTIIKTGEVLDREFLPIVLQDNTDAEAVNSWLQKRKIPDKRDHITEARVSFPGFENHRNMFSLSDQYWFKFNKNETWDKLNFFTNPYSQETGKIFFEPWTVNKARLKNQSPDTMTNGVLTKRWIQDDNLQSYLIKAGSRKYQQEPICEVMASMVLERMNVLPFVKYELTVFGMRFCSICKNFVNENTEFVPASYIYKKEPRDEKNESQYEHMIRMCRAYGIEKATNFINTLIAVNYVLDNQDVHLGNFGFLRNVDTGKMEGFAPLFDMGTSFWWQKPAKRGVLFEEYKDEAVKRLIKKINVPYVTDPSDLYRIVDMYPEITQKKKEQVREKIKRMQLVLVSESDRELDMTSR